MPAFALVPAAAAVALLALAALPSPTHATIPTPQVTWFNQSTDHFNQYTTPAVFRQRVLVHDAQFRRDDGVLLFYCGNEGDVFEFYNNTGWPFDVADDLGALIVFAEHRYYGESMPFGNASLTPPNMGQLSIEQALADYVAVIGHIKTQYNAPDLPVIALGGSYGGMLAAWIRIKYPHIVDIGFAASAPLAMVSRERDPFAFFNTVTNTFRKANDNCPATVQAAFAKLLALGESSTGRKQLQKLFNLCDAVGEDDVDHLVLWVVNSFTSLAMCDYPYPTDFLAPLPGFPVKAACSLLMEAPDLETGLGRAATLFYGNASCNDMYAQFVECADQTGCGLGPAGTAWDFQICNEVVYYPSTNNLTDMFPPRNWTEDKLTAYCHAHYGIAPRPDWLKALFGGKDIAQSASRILFSNGLLDPWSSGGFLQDLSETLIAVTIADGAHHLDLRSATNQDPDSVVEARKRELEILSLWSHEVRAERSATARRTTAPNALVPSV